MKREIEFLDEYLAKWDLFATQGDDFPPTLAELTPQFEETLVDLLRRGIKQSVPRMVFYAVIQIGGFFETDTPLGIAAIDLLGHDFPTHAFRGGRILFASDLYFWWHENRDQYEAFALFDEWHHRPYTKEEVLPMYNQLQANE